MIMLMRADQHGPQRRKPRYKSARTRPLWRRLRQWKGRKVPQAEISSAASPGQQGVSAKAGVDLGAGDRRGDFSLMTYEAMRMEVLYHLEQLPRIEQTALLVTATIFSWMAVTHNNIDSVGVALFIWYVPLVFSIFSFYRHQMAQLAIRSIADFIATKVAPELDAVEVCWEEQMRRSRLQRSGGHLFRVSNRIFWGGLIGANLLVPIVFVALRVTLPNLEAN